MTLAECKFKRSGETLYLMNKTSVILVHINTLTGSIVDLRVEPSYTILFVKTMLYGQQNLHPE